MKKISLLLPALAFCLLKSYTMAAGWTGIKSPEPMVATVELVSSDVHATVLKASVNGFNATDILTPQGEKKVIHLPGGTAMLEAGAPDLAKLSASVRIPDMAAMKVEVISSSFTTYTGMDIAPSKGHLYRNVDPSTVPFTYGAAYATSAFYPGMLASLRDPYILREYRGQSVVIYPFQYNPVTKELRVYTDITVRIYEDVSGKAALNPLVNKPAKVGHSSEFDAIYQNQFKNPPPQVLYTALPEQGNMLIISDAAFMTAMEPFVQWKKRRGMEVEVVDMATVGTTEADIKTFVANYYNSNGLTFLLLVGDYQQVPSPMQSIAQFGGASDPSYGYITGADSYAEVIVGRFSAQSVADVETQVQRILNYEMNPIPSGGYDIGLCIASNQGPGDDNEYDWEHERNIRTKMLGFTYTGIGELYDGSHQAGGVDAGGDPTNLDFFNELQSGVSIVNYTGHGSQTSFGTTGFSNWDISSLTNTGILPFIWSVGCVNGDFTGGTCIAEAFMSAQYNGQPTGAVGTFMSSINQLWDEPMDAQDEMVDLLIGSSTNHTMRSFGGLSVNGCMHMNDIYGSTGAEMTDTWHCFGDPSLLVRTAVPFTMTVSHTPTVTVGTSQLQVNCSLDSALVALTLNGEIIGTGLVQSGNALISFLPIMQADTIDVTVTGFNAIPYTGIVDVTGTTGISQAGNESQLVSIFPNPVKDQAIITLNLKSNEKVTVAIYDELGKNISTVADQSFAAGKHQLNINTAQWTAGVYYCRVISQGKTESQRFTVTR